LVAPYVGGEVLSAIGPAFRASVEQGRVEVLRARRSDVLRRLRAAAQRVPFNPWRSGVGYVVPGHQPAIKTFKDPINGETLLGDPCAESRNRRSCTPPSSDAYATFQYVGHGYGDRAIYAAGRSHVRAGRADRVEREIRKEPLKDGDTGRRRGHTRALWRPSLFEPRALRRGPGAHRRYVKAATAWAKSNDFAPLQAYLDEFVLQPEDHVAYLRARGPAAAARAQRVLGASVETATIKEIMAGVLARDLVDGEWVEGRRVTFPFRVRGSSSRTSCGGPNMTVMIRDDQEANVFTSRSSRSSN
jgi:glutaconate CoA-transferase subunit A